MPSSANALEQLVKKLFPASTLRRAWELKGGISAQVTALEIEQPDGQTTKLVLRQPGTWNLKHNPDAASDEFKLLQILQSAEIPVPTPYYVDESGEIFPTPFIVIEYIDGETDFAPANLPDFLHKFAAHLAHIHAVNTAGLSFLPENDPDWFKTRPAETDDSLDEGRIRDILEPVWPLPPRNPSVLLHGDYWPGNLLWKAGRIAAIIDWEDAHHGDPLDDLAISRLEILWAFGHDAMLQVTELYKSMTTLDFTDLPYWDLCAALRPAFQLATWATSPAEEQMMRERHHSFVAQALERLTSR